MRFLILLILSFLQVLIASLNGFSTFEDSANYIFMARHIFKFLAIDTISGEITKAGHFPPLYSFLIWLFNEHYLILHSLLLFISSLSIYLILRNFTFSVIFIFQSPIIYNYNSIMSESLFMTEVCILLLSLLLFERTNNFIYFLIMLLSLSLMPLTRHIGIVFIASIFLYFLIVRKYKISFIILLSFAPYIIFLSFANITREISFHPTILQDIKNFIKDFSIYLYYKPVFPQITGLLILFIFLYSLFKLYKLERRIFLAISIIFLFYMLFILITSTFLAAGVKNQFSRFLLVLFPLFYVSVILSKDKILKFFIIFSLIFGFLTLKNLSNEPLRYSSRIWKNAPSIKFIKSLKKNYKIYSNHPFAIYLLTNKHSYNLPVKINYITLSENKSYYLELQNMVNEVRNGISLVHFVKRYNYKELPSKDTLILLLKDYMLDFEDAIIFVNLK